MAVMTFFPRRMARTRLEKLAQKHASELNSFFEREPAFHGVPVERLVVNLLRHEYTDYDEEQTPDRHREACEAIAAAYPWVAEECERQIQRRTRAEKDAERFQDWFEAERELRRDEARELRERSTAAIGALDIGQRVSFRKQGRGYEGLISKVGRTRVTVTYNLRDGQERSWALPAANVSLVPQ
ncbi:hypothetical protein ACFVHW_04520 [Streptomyces sp. NPDC127110]|uniref:hypothetical protein n=1 Tax=Streptomyces sp. NPDC127110 TaxID=3345362 RepID=UPI0036265CC1